MRNGVCPSEFAEWKLQAIDKISNYIERAYGSEFITKDGRIKLCNEKHTFYEQGIGLRGVKVSRDRFPRLSTPFRIIFH